MYFGSNSTAIQSMNWLTEALISLMAEMEYHKITVMQICKKADLSRQTFYNFFNTKDEILHYRLRQQYEMQFSRFSASGSISLCGAVEAFETVLNDNRKLLRLMVNNHLESIITEEICTCVSLFASRFTVTPQRKMLKYGIAFLGGALSQTIVCWFKDENPVSASELAEMLEDILTGDYFDVENHAQ